LFEAFQAGELATDDVIDRIAKIDPEAAEALAIAEAVVRLARSHARLIQQVQRNTEQTDSNMMRLDAIEAELGNDARFITVTQTSELLDAIRAVGVALTKITGSNSFGSTHGEFHRRFGINSYKRLPAAKFDEAMSWLRQWYQDLTDRDDAPF